MQSTWEHRVDCNLSESGVEPLRVGELLDGPAEVQGLLEQPLLYSQGNGTPELRSAIADLYGGTDIDTIEVTNGCAEANFIAIWSTVETGDEVVMMLPNYMQLWGLARCFGARVRKWPLRRDDDAGRWRIDLDELRRLVGPRTRLILICNPNNPTGARLDEEELDEICRIAATQGTWILSDEVYRGSELDGRETPTLWGRYERAIVTSGLSKAYGLPGLRIGWIVAPEEQIAEFWAHHDYTTIAPSAISDRLATVALQPERRRSLLARTRGILRANYPIIAAWLDQHGEALRHLPPRATAVLYLWYRQEINSTLLAHRLHQEKSVLVVPGDHFAMDGYLRIGFGSHADYLQAGLERISELLATL
jgi:aspartate/methionine/tyrosine aminotransferase